MYYLQDIVAGLLYTLAMMPVYYWFVMDMIDSLAVSGSSLIAPCLILGVPLLWCLTYPKLDYWSTARGDTTLVLGKRVIYFVTSSGNSACSPCINKMLESSCIYCRVPARRGLQRTARAATRHGARDPLGRPHVDQTYSNLGNHLDKNFKRTNRTFDSPYLIKKGWAWHGTIYWLSKSCWPPLWTGSGSNEP